MKKILMIAIAALPLAGLAQATIAPGTEVNTRGTRYDIASSEAVYIELVVSYNEKEGQTLRTVVGEEIFTRKDNDEKTLVQMKELSSKTFKSVPDAMGFLSGLNFGYVDSYQFSGKGGQLETHLIFERKSPVRNYRGEERQRMLEERERQSSVKPTEAKPAAPVQKAK